MAEHGIRFRDVVAAQCPFCGAKGKARCESRRREIWRNGLGDVCEYRTYHIRCTVCNARGGTVGGLVANERKTLKIYGQETIVQPHSYYERLALEKWNRRAGNDCTDNDTAEWIYKEVRGAMTNVCSVCGSCSVYPDKYCGGCGRSMKNGY